MTPALSVSLIWLLAMLAAAAHMAPPRPGLADLGRAIAVYAATFAAASLVSPQPNWVGVLVGIAAFCRLIAGPMGRAGPVLAGLSAALAASLQGAGGLPFWIAASLGIAALLGGALLPGRTEGRAALRETVLIVAALAAPAIGLAADVAYGWHSATVLNRAAGPVSADMPPVWALAVLALALAAGVLRGFWVRR